MGTPTLYKVRALRKVLHDNVQRVPGDAQTQDFWVDATTRDLLSSLSIIQVLQGGSEQPQLKSSLSSFALASQGGVPLAVVDESGADQGFVLIDQTNNKFNVGTQKALKGASIDASYSWYEIPGTGGPIFVYENDASTYTHAVVGDVNRMIHIDSVNGSDAGDGSMTNPKRSFNTATWSGAVTNYQGGDMVLLKRGTEYFHNTGDAIRFGGPNRHMGSYGDPSIPRPILRSTQAAAAGPYTVLIENENCSFSDIDVDASLNGGDKSGVVISNGTREQDIYSVVVQNSRITGVTSSVSGVYPNTVATLRAAVRVMANGQTLTRTTSYNVAYDIDLVNVDGVNSGAGNFHTAGCAGKWINGVLHGVRLRRCKSLGCGSQADALGMTSFSMGVIRGIYPTYTLVGGSTYWFAADSGPVYGKAVPDIEILHLKIGTSIAMLRKNTGTPTAPQIGEFGFDVATQRCYINIGVALPTGTNTTNFIDCCTYAAKGMVYDQCLSADTLWIGSTDTHEGHGIAFDDFTSDSIVMNSELVRNQGMGISFNRGNRNQAINNRFAGNGYGAMGGVTLGAKVWGNWVEENTLSRLNGVNSVVAFVQPVYKFTDLQNRLGGFRRLAYTGSDTTGVLVSGTENFDSPANILDNSVVVPGVGKVYSGLVLARGLMTPAQAAQQHWSPKFIGL
jgi:hypothetical protein